VNVSNDLHPFSLQG